MKPTCKGCHAVIRWVTTKAGKAMPCDPRREVFWLSPKATGPKVTLITDGGEVVKGKLGSVITEDVRQVEGFIVHWGTCAQAGDFRR